MTTRQHVIDAIGVGRSLRGLDLRGLDLRGIDLRGLDLRGADLRDADLRDANLRDAYLSGADLRGADLRGAYLDFSSWPLWCGSLGVILDERLQRQVVYHALAVALDAPGVTDELIAWANKFHRVENGDVPALKNKDDDA